MSYQTFCDLKTGQHNYKEAKIIVVPVPYESTTTYGKGTKLAPAAILRASHQVEEFDEELGCVISDKVGIHTLKPLVMAGGPGPGPILTKTIAGLVAEKKIPIILGGEHSLSSYIVKGCAGEVSHLSVLHFDAHADLRDSYNGSKHNHACAARRIIEICPTVQVGIRNISEEGYKFAEKAGQLKKIHWARKLELVEKIENQLSKNVYITIDVDVFDPSVVPAVGTPEPGGMLWYEVLDVLKAVCATKNVVGFDVMELSPRKGDIVSDFTVAKLIYKLIGYLSS